MALTNLSQVTSSGIHTLSNYTTHNINSTGIITATSFSGNLSNSSGISTFAEIRVTGNLTVEGTTTTLDSVLNEVDRLEIGANTAAVGLAVTQSGTGHVATFEGGNVGIGTDNPSEALHLNGGNAIMENAGGMTLKFQRDDTSTAANRLIGAIEFQGNDSNGTYETGAIIRAFSDVGHDTGDKPTRLEFHTTPDNSATPVERLRIRNNGYVGINTTPSTYQFEVSGGSANTVASFESSDAISRILFKDNSGEAMVGAVGDALTFYTSTNATERLRITSAGNVGIGSESPASILDVYKNFSGVSAGTYAGRVYGLDLGVNETGVRFVTKGTGDLHNASDAYLMHGISNGTTRFVLVQMVILASAGRKYPTQP